MKKNNISKQSKNSLQYFLLAGHYKVLMSLKTTLIGFTKKMIHIVALFQVLYLIAELELNNKTHL